ncbi:MAG: penicillin-binding protein 2, partial [Clostridium sp.]
MQEKLAIVVLAIMLALFALIFVLYDIVKNKGDAYNQIVLGHQDYESRTIPYKRGNIVDRNGTYLATSEKVYNLILDPKQILGEEQNYEYMDATLEALNQCFGYDKEEVRNLINEKKDNYYVVYDKQLNADQKEAFETLKKIPKILGVAFKKKE